LQTFGGPAGQIAVMQRAPVDEKRWIGQKRFLIPGRTNKIPAIRPPGTPLSSHPT
jgi:hypothetical protein